MCCFQISGDSDQTVTRNNTYIRNPGYTSTTTTSATYTHTIKPISSDICQIRFDFETFQTEGPTTTGTPLGDCLIDTMTIKEVSVLSNVNLYKVVCQGLDRTGGNIFNPPIFCGIGTGQHLYIEAHPYRAETVDASLTLTLGNSVVKRKWDIRVTQVRANAAS